ncbi:MAG TPA: glycoside hydrolase family 16 protein, partial [Roseimicrobium sp.]|nr:glycoside hydrolase family 16 protein [Roseimicrobium sp.]
TFVDVINNEMQGFVPENIVVADGRCTIKVEQRDCQNTDRNGRQGQRQKFASGAFTSYGKFTPTYGYFEARIKMPRPRGAGIWPAFWMLPDRGKAYPPEIRSAYGTKKYGMGIEIDIFEFMPWWKKPDGTYPVHVGCIWSYGPVTEKDPAPHGYGAYAQDNDGWGPAELTYKNADTEFHTYGLYWSPERLIYYLDSKPIFRVKDPKHVPDVPHYFLFNISITGNGWGKSTDKKHPTMAQIIEDMPNSMEIDYFRAYAGTLDEAVPAAPTDNPALVRSYSPPAKNAPSLVPVAPAPAANPAPSTSPGGAPAAPVNSEISSPSMG